MKQQTSPLIGLGLGPVPRCTLPGPNIFSNRSINPSVLDLLGTAYTGSLSFPFSCSSLRASASTNLKHTRRRCSPAAPDVNCFQFSGSYIPRPPARSSRIVASCVPRVAWMSSGRRGGGLVLDSSTEVGTVRRLDGIRLTLGDLGRGAVDSTTSLLLLFMNARESAERSVCPRGASLLVDDFRDFGGLLSAMTTPKKEEDFGSWRGVFGGCLCIAPRFASSPFPAPGSKAGKSKRGASFPDSDPKCDPGALSLRLLPRFVSASFPSPCAVVRTSRAMFLILTLGLDEDCGIATPVNLSLCNSFSDFLRMTPLAKVVVSETATPLTVLSLSAGVSGGLGGRPSRINLLDDVVRSSVTGGTANNWLEVDDEGITPPACLVVGLIKVVCKEGAAGVASGGVTRDFDSFDMEGPRDPLCRLTHSLASAGLRWGSFGCRP